jgi:hypothetical protein
MKTREIAMPPATKELSHVFFKPAFRLAGLTLCALVALAIIGAQGVGAYPIASYGISATDAAGESAIQAGSHPDLTTVFRLGVSGDGVEQNLRDVKVDFPPGLVFNPTVVPKCTKDQLSGGSYVTFGQCPTDTQVGILTVTFNAEIPGTYFDREYPLFNMISPLGRPGRIAAAVGPPLVNIDAAVRSSDGYGITAEVDDASQAISVRGSKVIIWGVPADPSHDAERIRPFPGGGGYIKGNPSSQPRLPFVSYFGNCSAGLRTTKLGLNTWQEETLNVVGFDHDLLGNAIVAEGCGQLDFAPAIEARPTTNLADSPSGLDVKLRVPQNNDPDGLSVANLKDASITLPAGMTVNPSSANGLEACSPAQVGLTSPVGQVPVRFNEAKIACPSASKLGTVQIDTPLLDDPLNGAIYLASQNENPFKSLLALYIVVEDVRTGVVIKLAGHAKADPGTGQLTVSFDENPQLPFDEFKVNLFSGPRASLKTPMACGNFTTTSTMTPWSSPEGADVTPSDTFGIVGGANNSACLRSEAEAPNAPTLRAGTTDPTAGAYAPFVLKLTRADGTAPIKAIDATLPKGLLGKLAGIPYCPDAALAAAAAKSGKAEQAAPSCPALSRVGGVTVGAGAGSNPFYATGQAYLAGPYKGAPLSLAVITPAVAGPFDLGTVVIRNALNVDPETAKIHAVSDPIPTILQGIPLDIRSIALTMDRPSFTLNPTSCDPMAIVGGATSVFNQTAALSNPFQVGGCKALGFKPRLKIDLKGGTKRSQYPALKATLKARPGDANIGKAVVSLPHSEFLAQNHIKTICTRVQFAANACPPRSIYGKARAFSPLLDKPLAGPVYLRSSSNPLPDLVADLNGQIRVALVGRIDSVRGGIRTSFESVPDAPVSKFVLEMAGGRKGLLENSRNLCKSTNKANVLLDGQNGKTADSTPVVTNDCGKKSKKKSAPKGSRR